LKKIRSLWERSSTDGIIPTFNYKFLRREYEYRISSNGYTDWDHGIRIEALDDAVEHCYSALLFWADTTFNDYSSQTQLKDAPIGVNVVDIKKLVSPQRLERHIKFSPPLRMGQQAEILIRESCTCIHMDRDSIIEHIRKGDWCIEEPYEIRYYKILTPTDALTVKIIFPKGYPVDDARSDVFFKGLKIRYQNEYERIAKEGMFRHKNENGRYILSLNVPRPQLGLTYAVIWSPPTKERYELFLRNLDVSNA
jgi:hypothetical protein